MTRRRILRFALLAFAMKYSQCGFAVAAPPGQGVLYPKDAIRNPEDIKPRPLVPIPDDPPPHEGAMFDLPYAIEPPDLLIVEVIEALPGRPISGERLVRPDGTIGLGFYGSVYVRGLTLEQAKVKIIHHMTRFLPDDILGLWEPNGPSGNEPQEPEAVEQPRMVPLQSGRSPRDIDVTPRPLRANETPNNRRPSSERVRGNPPKTSSGPIPASRGRRAVLGSSTVRRHPIQYTSEEQPGTTDASPAPSTPSPKIEIPTGGNVKITIEVQNAPRQPESEPPVAAPAEGTPAGEAGSSGLKRVDAKDSGRGYVDVTAYNSTFYYVHGDVASPGKLPCTGNETVLDAINYSGGLLSSADPTTMRLVRPARGGKPAQVYKVDYQAILKADARANYQLFPGDRLIVDRNALIKTSIHLDRLAAAHQIFMNAMLQHSFMTRSLVGATPNLSPEQRQALLKQWFEIWWKAANKAGGPAPDERTFQEFLLQPMQTPSTPAPKQKSEKE